MLKVHLHGGVVSYSVIGRVPYFSDSDHPLELTDSVFVCMLSPHLILCNFCLCGCCTNPQSFSSAVVW